MPSRTAKPSAYYELRGAVVEMFYETLLAERYTIGQAASRCLIEFRQEILGGKRDALVTLATVFSRVARHEPEALARFGPELKTLEDMSRNALLWTGMGRGVRARLHEDVSYVLERAAATSSRSRTGASLKAPQ